MSRAGSIVAGGEPVGSVPECISAHPASSESSANVYANLANSACFTIVGLPIIKSVTISDIIAEIKIVSFKFVNPL